MSFLDLFDSGFKQRNADHFAAIVRVAMDDGIGLGFSPDNVKYVVDKALTLVSNGVDLDTFSEEIRNMNR